MDRGRAIRPDACDLRRVAALLYVNETIEEAGVADRVLGHPANGVAWLANKLAPYGGSCRPDKRSYRDRSPAGVAGAGDVIHADFGDLGAVTCRFR